MRLYVTSRGALLVVVVAALLGGVAGCRNRGTSIKPALSVMPAETRVVAVVDLAVARRSGGWSDVANPLFRLLEAGAGAKDAPAAGAAVDGATATAAAAAAAADAPAAKGKKKKAKLTGPLAVVESLLDDMADAGKVDPAADLDAVVVALGEEGEPPLVVLLGRGFSDKGLEAVLEARGVDADSEREKGLRVHTFGTLAAAVLDEHTAVVGDPDAVTGAVRRFGGDGKSAADGDKLAPALADVELPAAAYAFGVPDDDVLDALDEAFGFDGASAAKSFAAWAQVDAGLFHLVLAARAADDAKAAGLAADAEDALGKARKRAKDAPRPFAKLVKEAAIATRGAEVLLTLDLPAARFLREVEDDAAAAGAARALAARLVTGAGAGVPIAGLGGPGAGGLSAAETVALLGPLSSFSELVVVADLSGLHAMGLPASVAGARDAFKLGSTDTASGERFVAATGFDPLRDVSALAFAVERVSFYAAPAWLVAARATGFDVEKVYSWLTSEGLSPAHETVAGATMVTRGDEAVAVLPSGIVLAGTRAHVVAALESDGHRGETLAAALPPAAPVVGVYSGALGALLGSLGASGGLSVSGITAVAFSVAKEGGDFHGRVWLRGDASAAHASCESAHALIGSMGAMALIGARLSATVDGTSCLAEARVSSSLLAGMTKESWGTTLSGLLSLGTPPGPSPLPPPIAPDPFVHPPSLPPAPGGSMADMVAKVKSDPGFGTKERPIPVTAIDQEYEFLRLMTCGAAGSYTAMAQRLISEGGRSLDEVEAVCTSGGDKRTFHFDVTTIFGTGGF